MMHTPEEKPSTFTRHADGTVTVDYWPDQTVLMTTLLDVCDPTYVRRDGDLILITVSNGHAIYRVDRDDAMRGHSELTAIERHWFGSPLSAAPSSDAIRIAVASPPTAPSRSRQGGAPDRAPS